MNPFEILGIGPESGDAAVRKAYLDKVRRFSPEKDPEAFKKIQAAYEQVKDERSRIEHYLFNAEKPAESPLKTFVRFVEQHKGRTPLPLPDMKDLLYDLYRQNRTKSS